MYVTSPTLTNGHCIDSFQMKHTKEAAKLHVLPIKIIVSALARVSPVEDFLVNFGVSLESMIVDAQYKEVSV